MCPVPGADPAQVVEWREEMASLQKAVAHLDGRSRSIWQRLEDGASLPELAAEWRVPYDRVRRWRDRMLVTLQAGLHGPKKMARPAPVFGAGVE
jgi:hypothetical protein